MLKNDKAAIIEKKKKKKRGLETFAACLFITALMESRFKMPFQFFLVNATENTPEHTILRQRRITTRFGGHMQNI